MLTDCCSRSRHGDRHLEVPYDCHSSHCNFDIWGPEYVNHIVKERSHPEPKDFPKDCIPRADFDNPLPWDHRTKLHNMAFSQYALSFELAARELAKHPEAEDDELMQMEICRQFGVFLEDCTVDELNHLFNLANEFMGV